MVRKKKTKLLAVDGDNILHRAFYAVVNNKQSVNPEFNIPVMAIKSFFSMLNKAMRNDYYTHVAVTWDIRHTWLKRFTILEGHGIHYKNREVGMDDEAKARRLIIRKQKVIVHNMLTELSIPSFVSTKEQGIESDDLLGALAKHAKVDCVDIYTTDKDMSQLINERVRIHSPIHGYVDEFSCESVFKVEPHQVVDYLCLLGDTVDNIPGIFGCGHVTALKLLKEYEDLEGISKNKSRIKGKVGATLAKGEHLPFDVLRSLIQLDVDAIELSDPMFRLKPMRIKRIIEHLEDPKNRKGINKFIEALEIKNGLLKELGV